MGKDWSNIVDKRGQDTDPFSLIIPKGAKKPPVVEDIERVAPVIGGTLQNVAGAVYNPLAKGAEYLTGIPQWKVPPTIPSLRGQKVSTGDLSKRVQAAPPVGVPTPTPSNIPTTNMGVIPPLRPEDIRADLKTGGGFLKQAGIVDTGPNGEPIFTNRSLQTLEAIPGRGAVTQVTDADTIKDIMARRTEAEGAGVSGITDFTDYMSGKKVLPGVTEPDITFDSLFRDMVKRRQKKAAMEDLTSKANLQKIMGEVGAIPGKAELEQKTGRKTEAEIKEIEARTKQIGDRIADYVHILKSMGDPAYFTPEQATEAQYYRDAIKEEMERQKKEGGVSTPTAGGATTYSQAEIEAEKRRRGLIK